MPLYTKAGDNGKSKILSGERYQKDSTVFEVLGTLDELNASLGLLHKSRMKDLKSEVKKIQNDLFTLGSLLSDKKSSSSKFKPFEKRSLEMEKLIESYEEKLPPLKNFILPGGAEISARMHLCRAICRRLERNLVKHYTKNENLKGKEYVLKYINRLSDLLFILGRYANFKLGVKDEIWRSPE